MKDIFKAYMLNLTTEIILGFGPCLLKCYFEHDSGDQGSSNPPISESPLAFRILTLVYF